jgi:hypothetical protein
MPHSDKIPIQDLERPRLPAMARAFNAAARPVAPRLWKLDPDHLLEAARRRARLDDFGNPGFREPFEVLIESLEREAWMSPMGRYMVRELLLGLLVSRARLEALIRRHPEIDDEEVRAPVFILGLPRSGTSHLHNMLAQVPAFRSLPYWEGIEPIPDGLARPDPARPDPRVRRCEQALRFLHWLMPLFPAMHEITAEASHEEIQLQAIDFRSMLFECSYRVPSYGDWYRAHDQTTVYRYLRRVLKAMQWLRGPRRWLLKSPAHLEQLVPLIETFPDAIVVQTHREPAHVVTSLGTMIAYGRRMNAERVDPHDDGRYWSRRLEVMLRAAVRDQDRVPLDQRVDIRFGEFMADEIGTAERVLHAAGEPVTDAARAAIERYVTSHERGRHGSIDYRPEPLGLDARELRETFAFYEERFGVGGDVAPAVASERSGRGSRAADAPRPRASGARSAPASAPPSTPGT